MTAVVALVLSCASLLWQLVHAVIANSPSVRLLIEKSHLNKSYSIKVVNQGTGPAIITKCEMVKSGKKLSEQVDEVVEILAAKGYRFRYYFQKKSKRHRVVPGDSWVPMRLEFDGDMPDSIPEFESEEIRIWAKSIYGIPSLRRFGRVVAQQGAERNVASRRPLA